MIEYDESVDFSKIGSCILAYGPTNSGKTMSALTCEDPILHINTEGKDARLVHNQVDHKKQIKYIRFENYDDTKNTINNMLSEAGKGTFKFKTIFYDGLTFGQQEVKREIEQSRREVREDDKSMRGIVDYFRFEKPDWGAMGAAMTSIASLLMKFTGFGVTVICTALEDNNYPKWGQGVRIGPALTGQDFSKLLPGFFHFIGYVVRPFGFDDSMSNIYPLISFNTASDPNGNDYIARSSSTTLSKAGPAPLDWTKILKVIRGTTKKEASK